MLEAHCALIADIGGTNARFALVGPDGRKASKTLQCADHDTLENAIRTYLAEVKGEPNIGIFSVACPIEGDQVSLTNNSWRFRVSVLRDSLGFENLQVINDFEAIAYAVPDIEPASVRKIAGGERRDGSPIAVIGPGTGLGVASLVWDGRKYIAVAGEGGHVTMPATTPREFAIFEQLRVKYHHISAERVCSGKGLENLYNAIRVLDGKIHETADLEAAEISSKALKGECAICAEALDLMFAFLGRVAGNLALTLNAQGGVYIAGGIPAKLGDYIERSRFIHEFQSKGRMSDLVKGIPVYMVLHDSLGLAGLENLAKARL